MALVTIGRGRRWTAVRVILLVFLGGFYLAAATAHARIVNLSKARGDQSGYLWDAQQVYANWHGARPPHLIGQRMRMPAYAAFLALVYNPRLSNEEFFEAAKTANIWLSLALLAGMAVLFEWWLPPWPATNLTLIVAFSCFVFKAGYSQPELLFYGLFFFTFVASISLLEQRADPSRGIALGALTGALAGAAHLTKAVMPPFLALFGLVYAGQELVRLARAADRRAAVRQCAWRAAALATVAASFVAVVFPYIATSRRVFGEYFFNHNTASFMWYDTGTIARAIVMPHMDEAGRVQMPIDQLPTAQTYWRAHTATQVLNRLRVGVDDMIVRSYRGYGYLKYVALYLGFAILLAATRWRAVRRLAAAHAALVVFLLGYACLYIVSIAFFSETSGTGTIRFLLAHLAPLLFVLSLGFAAKTVRGGTWRIAGWPIRTTHFDLLVTTVVGLDLVLWLWPRLMTTYAGF